MSRLRMQGGSLASRVTAMLLALCGSAHDALAQGDAVAPDWLLDPSPYVAHCGHDAARGEFVLDNGLLRLRLLADERFALVSMEQLTASRQLLRAAAPLGEFVLNGEVVRIGGVTGQGNRAFLTDAQLGELKPDPKAFRGTEITVTDIAPRFAWRRSRHASKACEWPPRGRHVAVRCLPSEGKHDGIVVTVHLELYDGLPLISHWLELENGSGATLEVDRFTSLRLPLVEAESRVEPQRLGVKLPNLYVETDYAFRAMTGADGSSHCVRWLTDPEFHTQVNYRKQTLCVLEVGPDVGPAQTVPPGGRFETFRAFVLAPDREDRERQTLAQRRMYRTLAPWSTENPLMMHVRSADPQNVRTAIDQCADVGFEMAILTFGSGFNIEDDSQENLDRWRDMVDYAHGKNVELGGYSLLSSRRIKPDSDNCINRETGKPGGQVFGHAPALASDWGQRYFKKLYRFYDYTGFDLLEHDGSYPGDHDAAARPPLQKGYDDSRWVQFGVIRDFYRWCRGRGIYLNVPDWYFLNGSNKTGMGYRETNWSLPRMQQVIHTRQNLFDGTREKNPTMGWMFVPLTQYHGGGAAATVEPLSEHLDHYERMIISNLAYGAQACYRGPRLYDTDATRTVVKRWVDWYKKYRDILESDVIHGSSRRADGLDLDWVLHANPAASPPAMLVVFNPTERDIRRRVPLDLYYSGITNTALIGHGRGDAANAGKRAPLSLDRLSRGAMEIAVDAGDFAWFTIE
ncbi:MAG: alpha-galactosidase [bacterium]|nr:alpha-galactosidase [bacterium]